MNRVSAFLAALARNLRAGLRLTFLRKVEPHSFTATVEQLVALILIDLALRCVADLGAVGRHGHFNLAGLPGALFYLPWLLLAAYIVARREGDASLALRLPLAVLATRPYITLACVLLYLAQEEGWLDLSRRVAYYLYYWGPFVWWFLTAGVAVLRLTQRSLPTRLLHVAALILLVAVPLWFIPRTSTGSLWAPSADEQADEQADAGRFRHPLAHRRGIRLLLRRFHRGAEG